MMKTLLPSLLLVTFVLCGSVQAATYLDYQGAGGDLATAGDWYVISTPGNPASRTGVTRLPVKGGAVGSNNMGDDAFIRNGTTTTLSTTLGAGRLHLGGGTVTVAPPGSAPTVYLANGGTISILSDGGLAGQEGRLYIGETYGATLNQQSGSFIYAASRLDASITVTTGGVYNLSGGSVRIVDPLAGNPTYSVGYHSSGTVNQSGGTIQIGGLALENRVIDKDFFIGQGGYGEYNLSGGSIGCQSWTNVGVGYTDDGGTLHNGTGVVKQTGGTFQAFSYRMVIGDNNIEGFNNIGHYKLLGGTLGSPAPIVNTTDSGHIWLGRGAGGTGGTGVGKLTIAQAAKCNTTGFANISDATAPRTDASQVELKINSASAFDWTTAYWLDWDGALEVSFTDGYAPAVGTDWKIMNGPPNDQYGTTVFAPGLITPGFSTELRYVTDRYEVHLIYDAARKPGDANNDGFVDVGDLGILAFNWGQTTVLGKSWTEADFTGDDIVDVGDLGVLAFNWGWTGTPVGAGSVVPEPASLTLLGLGALTLIRRKR